MATLAQIAANQQNARQSTGAKTPAGKQRSSQNARRLGLFISNTTLAREEVEELARLLANYTAQYRPQWEAEHQLVRQLALATLRQHRYAQAEAKLLASDSGASTTEQIEANERTFGSVLRAQAQADRHWHKAYAALEKVAAKHRYASRPAPAELVVMLPQPNEPNPERVANEADLPLSPALQNEADPPGLTPEPNEPNCLPLGPRPLPPGVIDKKPRT